MSDQSSNQQYSSPPFGLSGDYGSTGAPGSVGVTAAATAGPVVGTPQVTSVWQSVQAAPPPEVPVHSGDTSSFSDDTPIHQSPLLPSDPAAYLSTGAGMGTDVTSGHHPNAGR